MVGVRFRVAVWDGAISGRIRVQVQIWDRAILVTGLFTSPSGSSMGRIAVRAMDVALGTEAEAETKAETKADKGRDKGRDRGMRQRRGGVGEQGYSGQGAGVGT